MTDEHTPDDWPHEILAWTVREWGSAWSVSPEDAAPDAERYTRTKDYEALRASRDELLEALEKIDWLALAMGLSHFDPLRAAARSSIAKARGQRDG